MKIKTAPDFRMQGISKQLQNQSKKIQICFNDNVQLVNLRM